MGHSRVLLSREQHLPNPLTIGDLMPKVKQDPYAICTNCLHLLTALHFIDDSTICDICLKNKGNK